MFKKVFFLILTALIFAACASKRHEISGSLYDLLERPRKVDKATSAEPAKSPAIVVDGKDLQVLERMNKAVEGYVLRKEKKEFKELCRDPRFDCFVGTRVYLKHKKKMARTVPPYASGSKMGLQGEERVQVRYDFYP